jgi:hypothetical protein
MVMVLEKISLIWRTDVWMERETSSTWMSDVGLAGIGTIDISPHTYMIPMYVRIWTVRLPLDIRICPHVSHNEI